jgi:histidinol-phosphatase (PHP family)
MYTSYHVHSRWSDGRNTIQELGEAARAAGLAEWGISDHYVLRPDGVRADWSMDLDRLPDYVAEVQALQSEAMRGKGVALPTLRMGLETDFFPGQEKALAEALRGYPWDYLIGAVHYVDGFPIDASADYWEGLSEDEVNAVWRGYWERIAGLARSGLYDFVAHLDLPKIFGYQPTVDLSSEVAAALDAMAAAGLAVEVNTAGWHKPCREAYPSLELLRGCHRRDIPALVSADAHATDHLARDLPCGAEWLRAAGYSEVVRFAGRRRRAVAL